MYFLYQKKNIDLKSSFERDLNLIENLTFETLLLEIDCNIPEITKGAIINQFKEDISSRIEEVREGRGAERCIFTAKCSSSTLYNQKFFHFELAPNYSHIFR